MNEEQERRRFFRINDELVLSYRVVSDEEINRTNNLRGAENTPLSLTSELEKMNEVSRIHLRQVEKESPEVARYFSFIEEKINLLAHHMVRESDELFLKTARPVNLSASGVSFASDNKLTVNSCVELKFILSPSLAKITSLATIISCRPNEERFTIAAEFSRLSDSDRDLLVRHVVKKQMNDIRGQGD